MGRPIKGSDALCNEIKIRVSDKTLEYIDAYAEKYGCSGRAEAIRMVLDGVFQMMEICANKGTYGQN